MWVLCSHKEKKMWLLNSVKIYRMWKWTYDMLKYVCKGIRIRTNAEKWKTVKLHINGEQFFIGRYILEKELLWKKKEFLHQKHILKLGWIWVMLSHMRNQCSLLKICVKFFAYVWN